MLGVAHGDFFAEVQPEVIEGTQALQHVGAVFRLDALGIPVGPLGETCKFSFRIILVAYAAAPSKAG